MKKLLTRQNTSAIVELKFEFPAIGMIRRLTTTVVDINP
jgi:hypothetical protein